MSEWDCNLLTNLIVIFCYWTNARSRFPWEVILNLNPDVFLFFFNWSRQFVLYNFNGILAHFFLVYAQYSNVSEVENCVHFYFISSTQYRYAFRLFKNEQYAYFHLKVWFTSLPHDTSLIQKKIELTPRSKSTKQTGLWESHLWSTGDFETDDTALVLRLWPVLTKILWSSQKKKNLLAEGP